MGSDGSFPAVSVYEGNRALCDFLKLQFQEHEMAAEDILMIPHLMLSFEDRENLETDERKKLKELSIISQAVYSNFSKFMSQNNLRKDESRIAEYKGEEKALRFDQLLGLALAEEHITLSKAVALKNQSVSQFKRGFLLG